MSSNPPAQRHQRHRIERKNRNICKRENKLTEKSSPKTTLPQALPTIPRPTSSASPSHSQFPRESSTCLGYCPDCSTLTATASSQGQPHCPHPQPVFRHETASEVAGPPCFFVFFVVVCGLVVPAVFTAARRGRGVK
ncbi:hypothetical protein BDZ91DRAFT_345700 [Kalaharituber pfeilii]|nr:hypothetical protein BDZ91DRAFT_345700 [Kalaharituber pfeilii]